MTPTKPEAAARYRVRFTIDPESQFEECNGEARPLTAEEYAKNNYRACPDHPRAGTKVVSFGPPQVQGCQVCGRTDYADVSYEEYLAYYGNPDRHVYVQREVERICGCCGAGVLAAGGGLGGIDLMDDSPELRDLDDWINEDQIDQMREGYLRELAAEGIAEARDADKRGDA